MKNLLITAVFLTCIFGLNFKVYANTFFGSITLESQSEVDAYDQTITIIEGNLNIITDPNLHDPITDLSKLSNLTSVNQFEVQNNGSLNEVSFPALTRAFNLYVQNNSILSSMSFPVLTSVDVLLSVEDNNILDPVSFPALTSAISIIVQNNSSLSSVSFPALTVVDALLTVEDHDNLDEVSFPVLTSVGNQLRVQNNSLLNIMDFPVLNSVSVIFIEDNIILNDCCSIANLVDSDPNNGQADQIFIRRNDCGCLDVGCSV